MEKNIIMEECFAENNQFLPDILDVGMGGGVSYLHFNYLFQSIILAIFLDLPLCRKLQENNFFNRSLSSHAVSQ